MDAEITVKFIIENAWDGEDTDDDFFSLEDAVEDKISESGFAPFLDELDSTYEIIDVKRTG